MIPYYAYIPQTSEDAAGFVDFLIISQKSLLHKHLFAIADADLVADFESAGLGGGRYA